MRVNVRTTAPFVRSLFRSVRHRNFSSSAGRQAQWGFIGLGQMGYNMARNLQAKLPSSDTIQVFDINVEVVEKFTKDTKALGSGAAVTAASSVREAAENSETTITVLPEPAHVKNVFGQILKPPLSTSVVANPDRLFIDCSTIDPTTSREVARAVHTTQQGRFVDAPMSGYYIAELKAQVFRENSPNNYLLAINNIATAEAMNLGIMWGLDPQVLGNLINSSTGKCWPSEINNPVKGVVSGAPAERDFNGGFGISLMKKDLGLALKAAAEVHAKLELGNRAREVYETAEQQDNCKGKDFSVVYKYISGSE
ncbi:hypothetical protein DID88_006445 [Monilinia fructigena]|uniref:3-hydroxyisobutyrate dehydrogenase n=1 Tax=Monilinia fructigena TaxID=38457 RepID=A0A395IHE6_9HELO|nr:hypothetical protein DID88_006445 [Monilinia fructigena]